MSDNISLIPTITNQGLQAVFNANHSGLEATISQIALGDQAYTVPVNDNGQATQTALRNEQQRVDIADGQRITPQQIDMSFIVDGPSTYWVRELGFYLADGTLFAVWSDPNKALAWKSDLVPLITGLELVLTTLPADSVTVQSSGAPLQLVMTREIAALSEAIIRLQQEQLQQRIEIGSLTTTTPAQLTDLSKADSDAHQDLLKFSNSLERRVEQALASLKSGTILQPSGGLYFEKYDTGDAAINLGNKPKDTWITIPVEVTISQSGTYLITANIRAWCQMSTSYQWKKSRVLINGIPKKMIFGFNKNTADQNLDSTTSISLIEQVNENEKITVEVYFNGTAPRPLYVSDGNGSSSIQAVKIG